MTTDVGLPLITSTKRRCNLTLVACGGVHYIGIDIWHWYSCQTSSIRRGSQWGRNPPNRSRNFRWLHPTNETWSRVEVIRRCFMKWIIHFFIRYKIHLYVDLYYKYFDWYTWPFSKGLGGQRLKIHTLTYTARSLMISINTSVSFVRIRRWSHSTVNIMCCVTSQF